jgi:hypothetical protein
MHFPIYWTIIKARVLSIAAFIPDTISSCDESWILFIYIHERCRLTAPSSAWTVFVRLNAGIVCSNPTREARMSVSVYSVCVGSDLATGWSHVQGVLPNASRIRKLKKAARTQQRAAGRINYYYYYYYYYYSREILQTAFNNWCRARDVDL